MKSPSVFYRVWAGEMLSTFGTQLTAFTLGVWALRHTDSVTWYAAFALAATAPRLLLAPLAGVLVDRLDRRKMLLFGHLAAGLCSVALALLFFTEQQNLTWVLGLVALSSLVGAAQYPAFQASISLLVAPDRLPRANGLVHFGLSIAYTLAPMAAGLLMGRLGIAGVLAIDGLTFCLAMLLLATTSLPQPAASVTATGSAVGQLSFGWQYLWRRPELLAFLGLFATLNFSLGMAQMLFTPLVLSLADETGLGWVLGQAGFGMLLGSFVMVIWGGTQRQMPTIFKLAIAQGLLLAFTALGTTVSWLALGAFATFFLRPLLAACSATVWQRKVDLGVQGRVFAIRSTIVQGALPLAYVLAGPLSDGLFEPWMAADTLGSHGFGLVLGVGPGRGIALLMMALGGLIVAAGLVSRFYPRLWNIESGDSN